MRIHNETYITIDSSINPLEHSYRIPCHFLETNSIAILSTRERTIFPQLFIFHHRMKTWKEREKKKLLFIRNLNKRDISHKLHRLFGYSRANKNHAPSIYYSSRGKRVFFFSRDTWNTIAFIIFMSTQGVS